MKEWPPKQRVSCPFPRGWRPREPAGQKNVSWGKLLPGWQVEAGIGGGGSLLGGVTFVSNTRSLILAESGVAGSPEQRSCPRPGQ